MLWESNHGKHVSPETGWTGGEPIGARLVQLSAATTGWRGTWLQMFRPAELEQNWKVGEANRAEPGFSWTLSGSASGSARRPASRRVGQATFQHTYQPIGQAIVQSGWANVQHVNRSAAMASPNRPASRPGIGPMASSADSLAGRRPLGLPGGQRLTPRSGPKPKLSNPEFQRKVQQPFQRTCS